MMNRSITRLRNRSYDRLRNKFMQAGGPLPPQPQGPPQGPVQGPPPGPPQGPPGPPPVSGIQNQIQRVQQVNDSIPLIKEVRKKALNGILNQNIMLKKENTLLKTTMKKQELIVSARKKPQDFENKRTPRQMGGVINPRQVEANMRLRRGGFITMKNK
jgi:hypothetical protein